MIGEGSADREITVGLPTRVLYDYCIPSLPSFDPCFPVLHSSSLNLNPPCKLTHTTFAKSSSPPHWTHVTFAKSSCPPTHCDGMLSKSSRGNQSAYFTFQPLDEPVVRFFHSILLNTEYTSDYEHIYSPPVMTAWSLRPNRRATTRLPLSVLGLHLDDLFRQWHTPVMTEGSGRGSGWVLSETDEY